LCYVSEIYFLAFVVFPSLSFFSKFSAFLFLSHFCIEDRRCTIFEVCSSSSSKLSPHITIYNWKKSGEVDVVVRGGKDLKNTLTFSFVNYYVLYFHYLFNFFWKTETKLFALHTNLEEFLTWRKKKYSWIIIIISLLS